MAINRMRLIIFLVTIFIICAKTSSVEVNVINGLPNNNNPLVVHCKSKNDDLGKRTLYNGQGFDWKFKPSIWGNSLFFCHFWWGAKDTRIDVYNEDKIPKGNCFWKAKEDGLYFSNHMPMFPNEWQKKYDW